MPWRQVCDALEADAAVPARTFIRTPPARPYIRMGASR